MVARYLPEPLRGIDNPEPMTRGARRELTPRYIDRDPEAGVPPRRHHTHLHPWAASLPAYQGWTVARDDADLARWARPPALPMASGWSTAPASDHTDHVHVDLTADVTPLRDAMRDLVEKLGAAMNTVGPRVQAALDGLRDAGLLPADDDGPTDPRARALWLRQHRGTGPSRDVVHQHRPRTSHHHGARR